MATRARVVAAKPAETAAPASEELELELAETPDGEEDALAELRGLGAGGDYKYTVTRVSSESGKKPGYCRTYALGDLSLDAIRDEFGGGKYRIRVTDQASKYVTMTTVDIVDLPRSASAAAQVIPNPSTDLSGIAALLTAVKPGDGGNASTMQMILAMMDSQAKMFSAMMQRPQETTKLTDILALINASKDNTPKTDTVALLLQGIELGKTFAGGGETGMLDVAKTGLEALMPLIHQGQQERAAHPAPAAAAPVRRLPAPAPDASARPATTVTAANGEGAEVKQIQQLKWITAQLALLVQHAARQKNPELYAEVMLDNLPPFITLEDIETHIGADDALDKLAVLNPQVTQFRAWFEEFRTAVQNFIADDESENDDTPPTLAPSPLDAPGQVDE